jgi:hypothetical protein
MVMIRTKAIVSSIEDVPSSWIFETYSPVNETLTGQDVKIRSVFNSRDSVPSMVIFCKGDTYYFKDFSTDIGGTGLDFVIHFYKLSVGDAINKIVNDYVEYLKSSGGSSIKKEIVQKTPYKLESYETRDWTRADAEYWTQYGICSNILARYNVKPLGSFIFSKVEDGSYSFFTTKKQYVYGYFRNDGSLYKIYQPKNPDKKFMKLQPYIQGLEQLEYKHSILMITSSLKDGMTLLKLGMPVEFIAPDSEGTILQPEMIKYLKNKYKHVIVMLDSDIAGIKAMDRYKETYKLPTLLLPLAKDISDSVKEHGADITRKTIIKLLV